MNKRRVDEAYWRKHKESWKSSGLSQRSYSMQEGLCNKKFNYHIKRLDKQSTTQDFKFIEAPINILSKRETRERGSLRIELPNRVVIVLDLSAELSLSDVIALAGAARC
jgi:hypothetical protein